MAEMTASAAHAATNTGKELIDVTIDYVVPIAGAIGGYFTIQNTVGGVNSLWGALQQIPQLTVNGNTQNINRIEGSILGVIFAAIGTVFWRMGKHDGWIQKLLGKLLGSYFYGGAANMLVTQVLLAQSATGSGLIDALVGGVKEATGG